MTRRAIGGAASAMAGTSIAAAEHSRTTPRASLGDAEPVTRVDTATAVQVPARMAIDVPAVASPPAKPMTEAISWVPEVTVRMAIDTVGPVGLRE